MSTQPNPDWTVTDERAVDLIRVLAMDAVQKAGSGHPGTAMSLAPAAYLLYQRLLRHDPADPHWLGRDRFVLSCGHSSLTLYIQLYLSGYGLTLDDLKAYRTWGSITPGHPEHGLTPGVETTTGPLGQGLGNAVGMAMAARRERGLLDPDAEPGSSPFDHHVYAFVSDGDIEEGISHEVSSLAAHQQLGNLIVLYDDNNISIEDDTEHRQVRGRRRAVRGLRLARAAAELAHAGRLPRGRAGAVPGALNGQGRHDGAVAHRAAHDHRLARPAQAEHRRGARLRARRRRGRRDQGDPRLRPGGLLPGRGRGAWRTPARWPTAASSLHAEWDEPSPPGRAPTRTQARCSTGWPPRRLPDGWADALPAFPPDAKGMATRKASGEVLNALAPVLPELWGGSADLAGSNDTTMEGEPSFIPAEHQTKMFPGNPYGRTLHFGIREHAMGAILNGIALHGLHPALRRHVPGLQRLHAALGPARGADGAAGHLRVDARLDRPRRGRADPPAGRAPVGAARHPRPRRGPARRRERDRRGLADHPGAHRPPGGPVPDQAEPAGARPLGRQAGRAWPAPRAPPAAATCSPSGGSRRHPDRHRQRGLRSRWTRATCSPADGISARVVSMPCVEWFTAQDESYRSEVLPPTIRARVSRRGRHRRALAGVRRGRGRFNWSRALRRVGRYQKLYQEFGITAERVAAAARDSLARVRAEQAWVRPANRREGESNGVS